MRNTFVLKAAACPSGARFADSNFRLSTENRSPGDAARILRLTKVQRFSDNYRLSD
jgi:hypothetical protein